MPVIYGNGKSFIGGRHFFLVNVHTVLLSVEEPRAKQAALLGPFAWTLWEYELGLGVEKARFSLLH